MLLGANDFIGEKIIGFCKENEVQISAIDLKKYQSIKLRDELKENYQCVISGDIKSFENIVDDYIERLGNFDYIVCNTYFDRLQSQSIDNDETCEQWEELLEDWNTSYFLLLKTIVSRFDDTKERRIIFFNSLRGYTGEGEGEGQLVEGGSMREAACASGLTGMMTSIARSIIPKGYSVNGIALGEDYKQKWDNIEWAINLWLTGMGEYSCGETYRVY
ncbi:MAG: SDR family NAD(P)-dependent oxidoreductase [Clostridiales bacterium]|nr:SDR family NAD(P)-dependent oxidoreductase [Clostridiales bacterium]